MNTDIYDKNNSMYEEDIQTKMGVYGQGGQFYVPIPNYISDTSMGSDSFANVCGSSRKHNEDYDPDNPICTAAATIVWYTCLGFS